MKNLDAVSAPEDVPTKSYVDNVVHVGTTQPTGSEIWIDTDEPDPTAEMMLLVASLEERVAALEARLA